jgi:hypothetical protein
MQYLQLATQRRHSAIAVCQHVAAHRRTHADDWLWGARPTFTQWHAVAQAHAGPQSRVQHMQLNLMDRLGLRSVSHCCRSEQQCPPSRHKAGRCSGHHHHVLTSARAPCLHSQCHAQIKFAGKETVDRLEYETDRGHVQTVRTCVCMHALRTACMCHCDSLSACVHVHNFRLQSIRSLEMGLRTRSSSYAAHGQS